MEKKHVGIGVVAILAIGLVIGIVLYRGLVARPALTEATATRGTVTETLSLSGSVVPSREAGLGFESGGRIVSLPHAVGDRVKAGELLAQSNDESLQANYDRNLALVSASQATLTSYQELLQKEKDKLTSLKKTGANTPDRDAQRNQIDASSAQVEAQKSSVAAAQASLRDASAQLAKARILAPFSGVLTRQDAEVGEVSAVGTPILTLIDDSDFKVETFVSELDVKRIQVGDAADITIDTDAGSVLSARVTAIDPAETVRNGVAAYKVTIRFDRLPEDVRSGTQASVKLKLGSRGDAIMIPESAVFSENGREYVNVSESGLPSMREITTGIRGDAGMVEVIDGLREGEIVLGQTR